MAACRLRPVSSQWYRVALLRVSVVLQCEQHLWARASCLTSAVAFTAAEVTECHELCQAAP
eukprot:18774-Heterococcus_DN1.PRE.2